MVFKCKMCGGNLEISENIKITECDYCGTRQTVPTADNEKKVKLFNRATKLRMLCDFERAANVYESIIAEFPEEAEAYWGLCLCLYGIEYVEDPMTKKMIPTCHRGSFTKLIDDENFKFALEFSDVSSRMIYTEEAQKIDRINEEILEISKKETPYDIFISYKETDFNGQRTIDSVIAYDLYELLTNKGYKVFFSRISLEEVIGFKYEPYIFAALNSAKIMICLGTDSEYFQSVWVKNEWSRFLRLAEKDKSKRLVPCYKNMDPYGLPAEFRALQAQDLGKLGAEQDLLRGISKILNLQKNIPGVQPQEKKETTPEEKTEKVPELPKTSAKSREYLITNVSAVGTNRTDDYWPTTRHSTVFDVDKYSVLVFHLNLNAAKLKNYKKISNRLVIYNPKNYQILDSEIALDWKPTCDKIARTFVLKGKDGTVVPLGKYKAVLTVEHSYEYEFEFEIISSVESEEKKIEQAKEKEEKRKEQEEKRRELNLCTFCGGPFKKNMFGSAKCSICGMQKNY